MSEDKQPNNDGQTITTGGGAAISGDTNTGGGDFTGRDKIIIQVGNNKREEQFQIILNWEKHGKRFRGFDLTGKNLSGLNLAGADLIETILHKTNLTETNLRSTILFGADLTGANLTGADLRGTKIDNTTKLDKKWQLVWEIVNNNQSK